jgi:hypothetical protein
MGKPKGKGSVERPGRGRLIILKCIRKIDGAVWVAFVWFRLGTIGRFL